MEGLDADNARAWRLFHQLFQRFLVDTQSVGGAFLRLTADLDVDDFEDVMRRLSLIYHIKFPPPRPRSRA